MTDREAKLEEALRDFVEWFQRIRVTDEGKALLLSMSGSTKAFGPYDRAQTLLKERSRS